MVTFDLFAPAPSSESTSSAADFPARTSALPGAVRVLTASAADYGASTPESLASFDRATSSWRTSQLSLDGDSTAYSETLPRSGTMRNGTLYRLPPLVRLIAGIGSGSLLPTPTASDATGSGSRNTPTSKAHPGISLTDWALGDGGKGRRLLPTPDASGHKYRLKGNSQQSKSLQALALTGRLSRGYLDATMQERSGATGRLNPRFVEWMMGFPPGWTEVDSPASETRSSRKSSK